MQCFVKVSRAVLCHCRNYLHVKRYVCPSFFMVGLGCGWWSLTCALFSYNCGEFFHFVVSKWNGLHDVGRFYLQTISVALRKRKKSTQKQKIFCRYKK